MAIAWAIWYSYGSVSHDMTSCLLMMVLSSFSYISISCRHYLQTRDQSQSWTWQLITAQNSHFFTSQSKKQVQGVCYFYAELSPACCMPPCSCGVLHTTSLVRGPTPTECLVPRPAAAPHQVLPWHQPQPGDSPECGGNLQSIWDIGHVLSLDPIKCVNFIIRQRLAVCTSG